MSPTTAAVLKLLHYFGFMMAVGGAYASQRALGLARQHSAAQRAGVEAAARAIVVSVELVGAFLALIAGIALIVADDLRPLKPATSGAGPWLHIKLTLVMIVLVVAHLRMFRMARLVRGRDQGATEAECEALTKTALTLGRVDLLLYAAVVFVAIFRYVLFVNA